MMKAHSRFFRSVSLAAAALAASVLLAGCERPPIDRSPSTWTFL